MKKYSHYGFYIAALIALVGIWFRWPWVVGVFDGWFGAFCIAAGEAVRLRNNQERGVVEKLGQGFKLAGAIGLVLFTLFIAGSYAYIVFVHSPNAERQAIEEYKQAHDSLKSKDK